MNHFKLRLILFNFLLEISAGHVSREESKKMAWTRLKRL